MAASFFIDVVVRPRGAARQLSDFDKALGKLDAQASKVARNLDRLFRVAGSSLLVGQFISIIDSYTNLNNKVIASTESMAEQKAVMDELFNVANRARVPIEDIATSYQRLRQSTLELGLSQQQVLRMTETLAKGLQVYGATQSEAASTMLQFTQALQKGKLDGEEFRALMENSPPLVKLLTKELKVTKGELFALSKAGKIGTRDMVAALTKGADEIDRLFAKLQPTIGRSFTVLRNEFVRFIGEMASTSGFSKAVSDAILFLADNFDVLSKVIIATSNAISVVLVGKAIKNLIIALRSLTAAALSNPFTALLAAIALVISLMYQFDVSITSVSAGTVKFQRVVELAWEKIKSAIVGAGKAIASGLTAAFDFVYEGFKELEIGFGDVLVLVGIFVDKFIALIEFLKANLIFLVGGIAFILVNEIASAVAKVLEVLEDGLNFLVSAYNKVAGKISSKLKLPELELGDDFLRDVADAADKTAEGFFNDVKAAFAKLTSKELGPVATAIKGILESAAGGASETKDALFDLSQVGEDVFKGIPEKGKKVNDTFDKLVESLYPAIKALNDLRDAKVTVDKELAKGNGAPLLSADQAQAQVRELTRLMKRGEITATQYAKAMQQVADNSKRRASSRITDEQGNQLLDRQRFLLLESADALGYYNYQAGQAQEQGLLLQTIQDQAPAKFQAEIEARKKLNKLIEDGIVLSDFELAAREERGVDTSAARAFRESQLETLRVAAQAEAAGKAVEDEAIERNKRLAKRIEDAIPLNEKYSKSLQEISDQYAAGSLTAAQFDEALRQLDKEFGFERQVPEDPRIEQYKQMQEELMKLGEVSQLVGIAFQALGEQITSLVTKGEADLQSLVDSMLSALTNLILKIIETRIMMALLGNPAPTVVPTNFGNLLQPAGFANGGQFMVGGQTGRDRNIVAFRASNDEDVTIRTAAQRRADERRGEDGGAPPRVSLQVINQNDPGQMVPVMGSRPGKRSVYNSMRFAPRAVERLR